MQQFYPQSFDPNAFNTKSESTIKSRIIQAIVDVIFFIIALF